MLIKKMEELKPKRQATRKRILEIAIEHFSTYGFKNSVVDDISGAADIAVGTLYLHFHSKEDLMLRVTDLCVETILKEIHRVTDKEKDPLEKFKIFFNTNIEYLKENPKIAKLLAVEIFFVPNLMLYDPDFSNYVLYMTELRDIIDRTKDAGYFHDVDTKTYAYFCHGTIDHIVRNWVMSDFSSDITDMKEKMLDFVLRGALKK